MPSKGLTTTQLASLTGGKYISLNLSVNYNYTVSFFARDLAILSELTTLPNTRNLIYYLIRKQKKKSLLYKSIRKGFQLKQKIHINEAQK